jgi:hypothetical protein
LLNKMFIHNAGRILFHLAVIAASASIALSLPVILDFAARNLLVYWSLIGNEKIFLISVEIALAIFLILSAHHLRGNRRNRRISRIAGRAGLVQETPPRSFLARRWKERQGFGREVLFIGSTGWRTFADPRGEFHPTLRNCREAKIMLLDPYGEGAKTRAKSILAPDITPERFAEQIRKSIDFLKELKAVQKDIRLKLYPDPPLFKLAILGDYLWIQHYHTSRDVQTMPEFVFQHDQNPASLYIPFYQYFLTRWNHPDMPEYDLETDELIYRDAGGRESRRERFSRRDEAVSEGGPDVASTDAGAIMNLPQEQRVPLPRRSLPEILGQVHFLIYQKVLPQSHRLLRGMKEILKFW